YVHLGLKRMNMNCGSIYRPDCKFKRAAVDSLARFRAVGDWLASVFLFVYVSRQFNMVLVVEDNLCLKTISNGFFKGS
ncbi:hypothetical protein Tco_1450315, partial [Tanacetum coccineum]